MFEFGDDDVVWVGNSIVDCMKFGLLCLVYFLCIGL